jgi:hypothetical protein
VPAAERCDGGWKGAESGRAADCRRLPDRNGNRHDGDVAVVCTQLLIETVGESLNR